MGDNRRSSIVEGTACASDAGEIGEKNMLVVRALVVMTIVFAEVPGKAADRHAGYYYPKPVTQETYRPRARTMAGANKQSRIAFVTNITNAMLNKNAYPPQYAMFSKGKRQEKLIIVSVRDDAFNTIFRARALLAQLTAIARTTRLIREQMKPADLTFLDLLNLMGFEQMTISDGKSFSHQIIIR